jgi:glycosyltransferase involved in cell wall biosynthesis
MAPFTGVCHHSHGCSGFQGDCSECPQVRNGFKKAVELNLTKKVFDRIEKNLILVAPTPWIAKQARASSVFKNQRIEVIENPIRDEFFQEQESASLHRQRPNSETPGQLVLTAVASDLSNPAKGIENIVDIYQRVREMNSSIRLNLIGRRGHQFNKPSLGIHWLGSLSAKEIIEVACQTSLLVSSSKAESAGLTVREFGALGVPSIAIRAGGIENLIEDGFSGFLVDDEAGLEQKLSDLATGRIKVSELGARALEISLNNKPEIIGQIYKDLYTSIH